jgi:hypothetical protein
MRVHETDPGAAEPFAADQMHQLGMRSSSRLTKRLEQGDRSVGIGKASEGDLSGDERVPQR